MPGVAQEAGPPDDARMRLARAVTRVPPFKSPAVRAWYLRNRRAAARARRRREEARGSDRLSRPAAGDLESVLERHLGSAPGFYVEAGANDGFEQSNTYWLERFRGWRGVLIEPVPTLYREVLRERRAARVFNCALVAEGYTEPTVPMRYGGLTTLVRGSHGSDAEDAAWTDALSWLGLEEPYEFEAPARTLSSILDEVGAPEIDLLSLDVEGYELEVLRGLDLDRHAPRHVLAEIRVIGREPLLAALGDRYEVIAEPTPWDVLCRRRG